MLPAAGDYDATHIEWMKKDGWIESYRRGPVGELLAAGDPHVWIAVYN